MEPGNPDAPQPPYLTIRAPAPPDPAALERDRQRSLFDQVLRSPDALLERLDGDGARRALWALFWIACAGHLAYGLVVGSFSGHEQWWAAPVKIVGGTFLCAAICFPSFYIFVSLSGAEVRARHVVGMLLGALASTGIFLAGFAPVAWVFSQSSTTVSLLAPIHMLVWLVSLLASQRMFGVGLKRWRARRGALIGLWLTILIVTCLQMMTTLRPILGRSALFHDPQHKFFLQHWGETLRADTRGND